MSTRAPHRRTLWEEGRRPGPLVALVAGLIVLLVVLLDLRVSDALTLLFDTVFVLVCTAAALAVRPRDFFLVGVLPPLLMAATIAVLAILSRNAIADPGDGFLQTMVSGLADRAGALVTGYALTLVVLALRQVALRNAGVIRTIGRSRPQRGRRAGRRPEQPSARVMEQPSARVTEQPSARVTEQPSGHVPHQPTRHAPDQLTGEDSGLVPGRGSERSAGQVPRARSSR